MTISYNLGIPAASHSPSNDQPLMQTNNDANDTMWAVDHVNFNTSNSGCHNWSTYIDQGSDPGSLVSSLRLYAKLVGGVSELFYQRDGNPTVIQLTGSSNTIKNSTTSPNVNFTSVSYQTFLPGGLIMMGGRLTRTAGSIGAVAVTFAGMGLSAFPSQVSSFVYSYTPAIATENVLTPTPSGFTFVSGGVGSVFQWQAVGF